MPRDGNASSQRIPELPAALNRVEDINACSALCAEQAQLSTRVHESAGGKRRGKTRQHERDRAESALALALALAVLQTMTTWSFFPTVQKFQLSVC